MHRIRIQMASALLAACIMTGRPLDAMEAEIRRVPIDVMLKASEHYSLGGPGVMTITITNLFDTPLLMNGRMIVNHPLLQGEISFRIIGPDGRKAEIERMITPLSLRDDDFVTLARGQSLERSVDLSDLYGIRQRGKYKIQVAYHNAIDYAVGARSAWKGIVWSETREIRIN